MVKDPEVGFMQATYWQLWMSFNVSFCLSYLREGDGHEVVPPAWSSRPWAPQSTPNHFLHVEIKNFDKYCL